MIRVASPRLLPTSTLLGLTIEATCTATLSLKAATWCQKYLSHVYIQIILKIFGAGWTRCAMQVWSLWPSHITPTALTAKCLSSWILQVCLSTMTMLFSAFVMSRWWKLRKLKALQKPTQVCPQPMSGRILS